MEIAIAAQGLPFGPHTIEHRSLGGSETAALMMARELRKQGHLVTVFCNLPQPGMPDYVDNGAQDELGVRWVSFDQYGPFVQNTELDLLIVSRNPDLFQVNHQAKKAVLWCHDLATYQGFLPRLMQSAWNFHEIWTVSEFHRQQIHKVSGYPLRNIKATRNGIVKFDGILDLPREDNTLLYSARPERGLENLVKPGGIMERLPEFRLNVTMYDNFPEHMREYYTQLWQWADDAPNIQVLGPKTQLELRQMMRTHWAYIYPTWFEEVSCIIARECIEQQLPFITTTVGALPETLGKCGKFYEVGEDYRDHVGSEEFCQGFADFVKALHKDEKEYERIQKAMKRRKDLYWDEVATQWIGWAPAPKPSDFSLIASMIKDSDIIPAIKYAETIKNPSIGIQKLKDQLYTHYPFLYGEKTFEEHYKGIYELEEKKKVPERRNMLTLQHAARYQCIKQELENLPPGSGVLEYGCAEGPIILGLAQDLPHIKFYGVDFVKDNIRLCRKYAKEHGITNVEFAVGSTDNWPKKWAKMDNMDHAIVAEVLEHVMEPWKVTDFLETKVKLGGRITLTVPSGSWEFNGLRNLLQWPWRAHIWHITKWMLRHMFQDKDAGNLSNLTEGMSRDGRPCGHLVMSFDVDRVPAKPVDPLLKAQQTRARQSLAACMISANDSDQILRCLNSIHQDTDIIQIALGPCEDHTREYIDQWAAEHPWVDFRVVDVPKIEAKKFGFDDARNESTKDIEADWILWIDSDEYLSGEYLQTFLKTNCFDSYAIHQHHFTCDPRGAPAQMDKPARVYRNDGTFQFYGKVHEHAEMGYNGGPGFVMVLPNIDIGHTGYVNDFVRRSRFGRNFPLLEWDRECYPDRKLGRYLWLRDIIHRIRMCDSMGNKQEARQLAEEAIEFYKEHSSAFDSIGGGSNSNNALSYYSEALKYLGRGFEIAVQVQLDQQTAQYAGIFETAEDAFDLGTRAVKEEMRKRKSGYWD